MRVPRRAALKTHRDAGGLNLMGTEEDNLLLSYDYMIRTTIRWLFFKYESLPEDERSWEEAVRAYNGQGRSAREYRDEVTGRAEGDPDELDVGNQ